MEERWEQAGVRAQKEFSPQKQSVLYKRRRMIDVQLLGYLEATIKHPNESDLREKGSVGLTDPG